MKLQAILSSVALAAALSFSGGVSAQSMIDGVEIPSDQLQAFQDRCTALQAASNASTITQDESVDETTTGSTGQSSSADPASQDYWDTALASVTLEECQAAGLL